MQGGFPDGQSGLPDRQGEFKAGLQPAPLCTRVHPGWVGIPFHWFPSALQRGF